MSRRPVTAIVVSYRTGPRLHECLYALDTDPAVSTIIVVDNGNDPADAAWIREFAAARAGVRVLAPGENLGFGKAVNRAAGVASEGYLLIVNPDAVLKRGSVEAMTHAAVGKPEPWIAGGKVFDIRGREVRGPRRRKLTLSRALVSFAGWNTWTLEKRAEPDGPVRMDVVSGALMLTDTDSFRALEGFDENYFLHVEDVDLCRRAWEAGGAVVYVPQAGALHYGSTSDVSAKTVAQHKADSFAHYFRKFARNPVQRGIVAIMTPLIRMALLSRAKD